MIQKPLLPGNPAGGQLRTFGDADGAVIAHAGRYAREIVLITFEMIGGVDAMAHWARANPTEFYTRIFTKTITRETELTAGKGIEDLLAALDRGAHNGDPSQVTLDAEVEIIE